MTAFNSTDRHVFHYLTFVTFKRIPIVRNEVICELLIQAIQETRTVVPFKLVAYVIMPDDVHLIVNPLDLDIELVGKTIKGKSARKILDWLKINGHSTSLEKLTRRNTGKRNHGFSVWQKGIRSVDLRT